MSNSHSSSSRATYVHIVTQIVDSVRLLVSQGIVTQEDAGAIVSKLLSSASARLPEVLEIPNVNTIPPNASTSSSLSSGTPTTYVNNASLSIVLALWGYNENLEIDPNDLSFRAGDVFQMTEETNADWWTGRFNGKTGLFPSNRVAKLNAGFVYSGSLSPSTTIVGTSNSNQAQVITARHGNPGPTPDSNQDFGPQMIPKAVSFGMQGVSGHGRAQGPGRTH